MSLNLSYVLNKDNYQDKVNIKDRIKEIILSFLYKWTNNFHSLIIRNSQYKKLIYQTIY